MKKRTLFFLKLIILLAVLATVSRTVWKAWDNASKNASEAHIRLTFESIDWRFGLLAILDFAGSMLTSAVTWRWIAQKMGDRSSAVPLIGAYTFSQMGKYVPGKVALLLMRIERSGRIGMTLSVCTVSTLLENALYVISGGLVGMLAIAHIAAGITADHAHIRDLLWPVTIAVVLIVASACRPRIFYGVVNPIMKRMKLQPVPRE
jgi:hypothetical protein